MKEYIEGFIEQLNQAYEVGVSSEFIVNKKKISSVLLCGLGGSGIGGAIVARFAQSIAKVPFSICNDYHIPAFVNNETLVIASSYSGDTEETLTAVREAQSKGAEIAAVTSGGKLKDICDLNGYNYILIPGGKPPRTCLGLSLTEQIFILVKYGILDASVLNQLQDSISLLKSNSSSLIKEAENVAEVLLGKISVIYSVDQYEPISIRFRQQLNENSKELCWHQKFPELNHNEIVGWASGNSNLAVVILRNKDDYYRTQERIEFMKTVVKQKGASVTEIWSKGNSFLEKALYLIYLTDWTSLFIANKKGVDPIEIRVIDALKDHLATIK
jgi:glucose/mannose-6-phosphate isomerase